MYSDEKIGQIAGYFLTKSAGRMPHLKLMKLMYLADREALRQYGRPMTFDNFVALPHGPVLSRTLDLIHDDVESEAWSSWIADFLDPVSLLGAFLSGGIDSASITAMMSTLVDEPIRTFSVAFAEREANELAYARLVAERYRTDHHETVVTPDEFFAALPRMVWHEDEPIAHPSSIALYFVSRLAAERVKVVLTGEGSDETLGGYGRYRYTVWNMALGRLARGLREGLGLKPDEI